MSLKRVSGPISQEGGAAVSDTEIVDLVLGGNPIHEILNHRIDLDVHRLQDVDLADLILSVEISKYAVSRVGCEYGSVRGRFLPVPERLVVGVEE